jgi:hypothetical protein
MKESGTKDPTLLMVTAGPGVRFTMETAQGTFSFLLAKSEFERFEATLRQAGAGLTD